MSKSFCDRDAPPSAVDLIDAVTLVEAMPHLPLERAEKVLPHLNHTLRAFSIDTKLRIAAFLAQVGHESMSFKYSTELASGEAYDVGRLAKRLGNTPEDDGDGEKFKGRGWIQLTGTANYRRFQAWLRANGYPDIDLMAHPERVAQHDLGSLAAGWYWWEHRLNNFADLGPQAFDRLTRAINGGLNGKADRDARYKRARQALGLLS